MSMTHTAVAYRPIKFPEVYSYTNNIHNVVFKLVCNIDGKGCPVKPGSTI